MNKLVIVLFICLCMCNIGLGQGFYDINTIQTIELFFVESNWDQILDNLYAAGNEERLIGTAIINGVQYDSVGVRYKGNSSYRPDQVKNPLNIKLDHIIDDQEIEGYGTLKLANVFKDPSFVREVLSYEIARDYMPAGQANFIKVYINGNLVGLYTSVQDVDKLFMRTHFYNDENARFKGELQNDSPQNPIVIWDYIGTDSLDYFNFYEIESDSGWNKLVNFLDIFNNNPADVEDVLDVDNHLWMLAYDILMVNLDAPVNFGHNYYLFEDGAGQFNPILWDLNENFGVFAMLLSGGPPLNVSDMQQLDPYLHSTHPDYPIINKILPDPTYQKMYIAHMRTLIEEKFDNDWYETRAHEIQSIIDTDVQADPNKFYSYSDFLSNIDNSVGFGPQSIVGITQLMAGRLIYLNNLSDFQATPPAITNISNDPENVMPNSTVWITTDVSSANIVRLCFRHSIIDRFDKIEMFDDGVHNDGSADDGTYGISVQVGSSDLQYYIYAENSNAAMFSPQRAEYEFYSLPITGEVAINEFLADNVGSWADQDDEYDDWVELYNGGSEAVSLNGYYLTDDVNDLLQWPFPDTSIAAGGYLIIWADDDEGQTGLHANFKLSASGESILLVDPSHVVADEIVFGQQSEDISYGRYPDGGENMISMDMTPANPNTDNLPPMISGVDRHPSSPGPGGDVYIAAEVVDENAVNSVLLVYDAGSGFVDSTMYDDGFHNDGVAGDGIYGGIIPGQLSETLVQYYIYASDVEGATRKNPLDAPISLHSYIVGAAAKPLYINEFMASNDSSFQDPQGEYEDWIEIYNGGSSSIDLGGMYLTDDLSDPTQWIFPDTTIEAGGYILIWADEDEIDSGLHANFKLGASGEQIGLFETDENGNVPIDTLSYGEQSADISYGRCPDGTASWMFFASPTPGNINICGGEPPVLFINEFLTANDSTNQDPQGEYDDWIEIYNPGEEAVNLAGLYLTDDLSDPLKWAFPDTVIAANDYLLVWADEDVTDPGLHTNFKLSDSGEQIGFFDIDANGNGVIDSLTYGDQYNDTSYGRCPDGTENWMLFDSPTPEAANICEADYQYLPGDANMFNGQWPPQVIGGDVTYLVNYFRGMEANVPCFLEGFWASGDANGDCLVIGSDVTKLVNYFRGMTDLQYCIDFESDWPTPADLPAEAPVGWPNCEATVTTSKSITAEISN